MQVNITDSDAEGEEEQFTEGDKEQGCESSTQSETHTYYIRVKEKVDITQQKRDQLEKASLLSLHLQRNTVKPL